MQEMRNSIANALKLHFSCNNPTNCLLPENIAKFYFTHWWLNKAPVEICSTFRLMERPIPYGTWKIQYERSLKINNVN